MPHSDLIYNLLSVSKGYQTILQRLVSTTSAAVSGQQTSNGTKEKDKENEINLQLTSHAGSNAGMNHDVVRYMLLSSKLAR